MDTEKLQQNQADLVVNEVNNQDNLVPISGEDIPPLPLPALMKLYEVQFTGAEPEEDYLIMDKPIEEWPKFNGYTTVPEGMFPVIRVDGHCFHTFTRSLEKPFDRNMTEAMLNAASELVKFFHASFAYTQSDEITVVLPKEDTQFSRKTHKMASLAASVATVAFVDTMRNLGANMRSTPAFDGRAFAIPDERNLGLYLKWRERDAYRNAISAIARSKFSHKQLLNKNTDMKIAMLAEKGVNVFTAYPDWLLHGDYIKRMVRKITISDEELKKLPEKHQARQNPEKATFYRSYIGRVEVKHPIAESVEMLLRKEAPVEEQPS